MENDCYSHPSPRRQLKPIGNACDERRAIEQIIGRKLERSWPDDAFAAGTRVRIVKDPNWNGPWKEEFSGTIDDLAAPELVDHPKAHVGELKYWVIFDSPQYDCEDCGPYYKASIWGRYVRPVFDLGLE